jgi:hypothetical protein
VSEEFEFDSDSWDRLQQTLAEQLPEVAEKLKETINKYASKLEKKYTLGAEGTNYIVETLTGYNYIFGCKEVKNDFVHKQLTFVGEKSWVSFGYYNLVTFAPVGD